MTKTPSAIRLAASALLACAVAGAGVYQTAGDAELFVDDTIIATSANLERVFHQAAKLDAPVLRAEKPWEEGRVYLYGGVHRNEKTGLFRMWYNAGGKICYAESQDGITWMRPDVGLHEYEGSRKNNILLTDVINTTVFIDEHCPDPLKKYKALIGSNRHFRGAYSADGINWKMYNDGEKLMAFGSEMATVSRDEKTGEYLAFIRPHPPKLNPKSMKEKRTCALTTSKDFINWSPLEMVFTPDEMDDQWLFSKGQRTEFYGWSGFKYGSQWLGFITVFRLTGTLTEKQKLQAAFDGPIDVQLIHGRDGRKWRRTLPRTPVIPNGPHSYDAGTILHIANNPLVVGDEVWLYYTAINTTHGGPIPPKDITIALAKWRLDGFASLRARWAPGVVQTVPMATDGGKLFVNADMSRGQLAVALLDSGGRAFPGFTEDDCEIISSDSIRHRIKWKGGSAVPAGKPFALRFHLTNGDLYSFRISPDE
jgi:hypothetical protein